jgi:hypothetical protein
MTRFNLVPISNNSFILILIHLYAPIPKDPEVHLFKFTNSYSNSESRTTQMKFRHYRYRS